MKVRFCVTLYDKYDKKPQITLVFLRASVLVSFRGGLRAHKSAQPGDVSAQRVQGLRFKGTEAETLTPIPSREASGAGTFGPIVSTLDPGSPTWHMQQCSKEKIYPSSGLQRWEPRLSLENIVSTEPGRISATRKSAKAHLNRSPSAPPATREENREPTTL